MIRAIVGGFLCVAACTLVLSPTDAAAQSAISGTVRDQDGLVLPGVSVEASSPALIDKARSMVTDDQGRFSVVDLRPGIYKLTFALQGFSTVVRDGLELPSNFVATVNVDLRVGALEETVTVSGQSPLVDVESTQKTTVLSRELLDGLPSGRTYAAVGALAVGIKMNSSNVGGARTAGQQRLLVHGLTSVDNTIQVDGLKMNTLYLDGDTQPNHNDGMSQEITVLTSSAGADVSGGGVVINLVPREGGNTYSGSMYLGYVNSHFQGRNLTGELRAKGLTSGDSVQYISDWNPSLGGPVKRDKLWFFGSFRDARNANRVANSFYPDGSPGLYDLSVQNMTGRLTWQLSHRDKVSVYADRAFKFVGHAFTSGTEPDKAAAYWTTPLYYTGAVKWTSVVSSKLLLDTAWGAVANGINGLYRPGVMKDRGTPEWYANASRSDIVLQTRTTAAPPATSNYPFGYLLAASASYVTGSHSIKGGVQWRYGTEERTTESNADLVQQYRNRVPDSVIVYNTPSRAKFALNHDTGAYIQDAWRVNRFTITPGIRFEFFNASIEANEVEPGRFVPFRATSDVPDLPNWINIAPRFGVAYDLFGNTRTALKASVNKYYAQQTDGFAARYSPAVLQSDTRNWSDCDYTAGTSTCSGRALATNGDDIAQDNEIGPSNNRLFGQAPARHPDPDIKRVYSIEYTVGVDHQLFDPVAVGFRYYRRRWRNLEQQINTLVETSDYAGFTVANPLSGEPLTVYNLNRAKQGLVDLLDRTTTDSSKSRQVYDGIEANFSLRLPKSATVFGGWAADRAVTTTCGATDPNTFRDCDQAVLDMPFRYNVKLSGTVPLPLRFQVGAAFQSYAGGQLAVNWAVPVAAFPGGQRTQSVTVNLIEPGTKFLKRWNQLDLNVKRNFAVRSIRFDLGVDIFNALNSSVVLAENQNFGTSLGQPTEILQPIMARLSANLKF